MDFGQFSLEIYDRYKNNKQLKVVFRERLLREVRFNNEVLKDFLSLKIDVRKDKHKEYIGLLETSMYDFLEQNFIALDNVIDNNKFDLNDFIRISDPVSFQKFVKSIESKVELIERVYLKIKILKSVGIIKEYTNSKKYDYIRRLSRLLEKILESDKH
jgi:hypothetical protein